MKEVANLLEKLMYIGDFTKFTENYIKSIWKLEIGFWEENLEAELQLEEEE